ncbi:MAG: nucleotidyltransferase family protein [Clostridia bacterium]|nr:nucleotidyltransferase family protein [Clostridia bacterium]
MKIAVICEYNPFHAGHAYQMRELRRLYGEETALLSVLGGVFSQRGEPYFLTPYARARAAVECGGDLVVELPFPYSCARAAVFARAGVEIAARLGADALAFGSECGDIETLQKIKEALDSPAVAKEVARLAADQTLGKSKLYAAALKKVCGLTLDDTTPNDILAVEYLRAIDRCDQKPIPIAIRRVGDHKKEAGGYPAASHLRALCKAEGLAALCTALPPAAADICVREAAAGRISPDFDRLSSAILLALQNATAFPDDGGLTARLAKAAVGKKSLSALLAAAKTKRYTDAELRRAALFALLPVEKAAFDAPPAYTKLLAASARGCAFLNGAQIEILTKPGDHKKLSEAARAQFLAAAPAERAFALCFDGDYDYTRQTPFIAKENG